MTSQTYPCYVRIGDVNSTDEFVELPTENDGSMLLTTLQSQFPDATGLRFKSESGAWRGVGLTVDAFTAPLEGWGYNEYYVTLPKAGAKRKLDDEIVGAKIVGAKTKKATECQDLIVLGLPFTATEDDLNSYFVEKFGELESYQIKTDQETKKSRGFAFIRCKSFEVEEAILLTSHIIMGRKVDIRYPNSKGGGGGGGVGAVGQGGQRGPLPYDVPTKLFVGHLAGGTKADDLREHFSLYGDLTDVYIPTKFRGFGFVTFASEVTAREVLCTNHMIKGNYINLQYPTPKGGTGEQQNMGMQQQSPFGMQGNMAGNNMQVNMQGGMQRNMQAGNMQGGNMPGGNRPGGNMQGGNMPSGNMQGGNMQSGNMPSGNMQGGNMQGGNMQAPQGAPGQGFGNRGNNPQGYYSNYFKAGGTMQNGKLQQT